MPNLRRSLLYTACAIVVSTGACGSVSSSGQHVGGTVRGLWDGADGVGLRLQADGLDTFLVVPANGPFAFSQIVSGGISYTISIATNPTGHSCTITSGGNGIVGSSDSMNASIVCKGPDFTLLLSNPWGWTFDATQDTQTFDGSLLDQEVTLTVNGTSLSEIKIDGTDAPQNAQTSAIPLPLGSKTITIKLAANGGLSKTYSLIFNRGISVLNQVVYGKASNSGANDGFGFAMALSGDTLAVAASGESSSATGINGNQTDNNAINAGAVYVFVRNGTTWTQQAYIKASNTEANDNFGWSVALLGDTLAVGAIGEDSSATGFNGNQADNSATDSGAVYVFLRIGTTWTQQAYIKASNTGAGDSFGHSVALSGNSLAVGASNEDSAARGINGNQLDNSATDSGAVYIFVRNNSTWVQQAYLKASNTDPGDDFGQSLALSGDTLAVAAKHEASAVAGIDGNQADNSAPNAGAVYVFVRNGSAWAQQAYIKASNPGAGDLFGDPVALDGDTLVVGAGSEASSATGINGNQADNSVPKAGAAYVFVRINDNWTQQAYIKASNTGANDGFGARIAILGDVLAISASDESSSATGINGDQTDNGTTGAGAVYVFTRSGVTWSQQAYVKASNPGVNNFFGFPVVLSADTLVIAAGNEESNATGINGNQADNSANGAGAIYIFR